MKFIKTKSNARKWYTKIVNLKI